MKIPHIPVLKDEIVELFSEIEDGYIVDCTVGYGGHSEALLQHNQNIKLICIDRDKEAIAFSKKRLEPFRDRVKFIHARASDSLSSLRGYDIRAILADIGVSSLQLDKTQRGFGFESDRLDMRMDQSSMLDAKKVVNEYSQSDLERIFREYGEMRDAKRVAHLIVKERFKKSFESSKELSSFFAKHIKSRKLHPATLPFQAIRIEVNDEIGELKSLLNAIEDLRLSNSLIAIISFHSLEDRVVKNYFREWAKSCICPSDAIRCSCGGNHAKGKIVTKKPIIPTGREIEQNPRSRSSKLRVFRFEQNKRS